MSFAVGDFVRVVKVFGTSYYKTEARSRFDPMNQIEARFDAKKKLIGKTLRIFSIESVNHAFPGQIYGLEGYDWLFHAEELEKVVCKDKISVGDVVFVVDRAEPVKVSSIMYVVSGIDPVTKETVVNNKLVCALCTEEDLERLEKERQQQNEELQRREKERLQAEFDSKMAQVTQLCEDMTIIRKKMMQTN